MDAETTGAASLPAGYRVVAVASDVWVLVAPGGIRVARYFGNLDLWKAARDAWEHQERAQLLG
jgi:hypothetical protein